MTVLRLPLRAGGPPHSVSLPSPAARRDAQAAVGYYLHEPLRETRQLLREHRRRLLRLNALRDKAQARSTLRACADSIDCPSLPALRERLRQDRRSRIIATFHLGNYIFGLNYLSRELADLRSASCLILEPLSDTCFRNLELAFGAGAATREQMLLLGQSSALSLAKLLRRPARLLFIFVDLPPGFGRRRAVRLLGRPGQFGSGAATLAVLNGVPVLPLILESRGATVTLRLGPEMEPRMPDEPTREASMARISQSLADLLSGELRRAPADWRYLSLLADYYRQNEAEAAPGPGPAGEHRHD